MKEEKAPSENNPGLMVEGERMMLVDNRQRRYLIELANGDEFHSHSGVIAHDEIIGTPEGTEYRTGSNARFVGLRPTINDHVLKTVSYTHLTLPTKA